MKFWTILLISFVGVIYTGLNNKNTLSVKINQTYHLLHHQKQNNDEMTLVYANTNQNINAEQVSVVNTLPAKTPNKKERKKIILQENKKWLAYLKQQKRSTPETCHEARFILSKAISRLERYPEITANDIDYVMDRVKRFCYNQ